ncbi:class I SAM-dependent methyltransferase [Celerinatantimonas sp. YJH-8]|uniref:class I SAM-dependent methyltransferase n=1 Tax=Celerinatantimonas sp. YJH-8 TaxID=3228714 RepID=UPI0038C3FFFB
MEPYHHEQLICQQFGSQAQAYLTSAVHASGDDLTLLVQRIGSKPDAQVLDLGCGGGHVSYQLAPHVGRMVAYDLSESMLDVVRQRAAELQLTNVQTQQGNVNQLPFADQSFDYVVTRFSAHHWVHWEAALREMRRVLKPSGQAIIIDVVSDGSSVCDSWLQAIELLRDPSHVRDYATGQWVDALARSGLTLNFCQHFPLFLDFQQWLERMQPEPELQNAIHCLLAMAPLDIRESLQLDPQGNFTLRTLFAVAVREA